METLKNNEDEITNWSQVHYFNFQVFLFLSYIQILHFLSQQKKEEFSVFH